MAKWKEYGDECPNCGAELEVLTDCPGEFVQDGDPVRCTECGLAGGQVHCDDEHEPTVSFD